MSQRRKKNERTHTQTTYLYSFILSLWKFHHVWWVFIPFWLANTNSLLYSCQFTFFFIYCAGFYLIAFKLIRFLFLLFFPFVLFQDTLFTSTPSSLRRIDDDVTKFLSIRSHDKHLSTSTMFNVCMRMRCSYSNHLGFIFSEYSELKT